MACGRSIVRGIAHEKPAPESRLTSGFFLAMMGTSARPTMEKEMANEQRGGSGNFANDPQRASEADKKGGEHSHGGQQSQGGGSQGQQGGGGSGNPGNFANDREKAREAGRKGGQS
jgi:general stress protein YciG